MVDMDLTDSFDRKIRYLRISVTDRCDFRCIYCMAENMTFSPREDSLTFKEIARLAKIFISLGVNKIRVTGGEPLVRHKVIELFDMLGGMRLKDLCLTTNGSRLKGHAKQLVNAGVTRVNISLDTLNPLKFRKITRFGDLNDVLDGIYAAKNAGFQRIKLNCVLMRNYNLDEAFDLTRFALDNDLDISFIEEMPLGEVYSHQRQTEFISSEELRLLLAQEFALTRDIFSTGGPSRYWRVENYSSRIGFISPHSHNFCSDCNRLRLTTTGRLLLCLGNENSLDLRELLRSGESNENITEKIVSALRFKPEKHHFNLSEAPQILRFMNETGG